MLHVSSSSHLARKSSISTAYRKENKALLIRGCALLAPDEPGQLLRDQDILIEGAVITAIGARDSLSRSLLSADTLIIEGDGRLALPGLINAHTHSLENLLKATSPSLPLELWLVPLFTETFDWSPRAVYLSVMLGALEMLKSGTTAVLDHLWTVAGVNAAYLDATMQAYRDVGIRATVAPAIEDQDLFLEAGQRRGLAFPDHPFINRFSDWPAIDEQIATLESFLVRWHNSSEGRIRAMPGPSGIHWCSPRLLNACRELAQRYHTGMHLHAVETELQARVIHEALGEGGISYLHHMNLLRPGTSLAHTIWLESGDLELLAHTGATVVHNPVSNLRLGSGHFPLSDALEQGVSVALGSDGSASNDTQNMFGVLKLAGLMHNHPHENYLRWPQASAILHAAIHGGATALDMTDQLGQLAPGYLADLVLLDIERPAFFPLRDPYLHLIYCEQGASVDTVIVHGEIVVAQGQATRIDEHAIYQELRDLYRITWPAFSQRLESDELTRETLTMLAALRDTILQKS